MEKDITKRLLNSERWKFLEQIESWLEMPIIVLGFVWLILLVVEFIWGLSPALELIGFIIWGIFIIDFLIRFLLAPDKSAYLKSNWISALSLTIPALRVFRIFRAIRILRLTRTVRGIRLVRVVSSLNRGLKAMRNTFNRRGFSYIVALTLIVTFVGAAGMYAFESSDPNSLGFKTYMDSLWWTSMMMTTAGSEFWPRTAEGRTLAFILALYSFAIFGYVTATLASFFVGREADSEESEVASEESILELQNEIKELKEMVNSLLSNNNNP